MDPAVITAYFLSIADEWASEGLTQDQIAQRVGTSGPFVSQLRNGRRQLGDKVAGKVAAAMGISFGEFLVRAEKYAAAHPERVKRRDAVVVRDSRYPNLDAAVQFAAASSTPVSAEAVEHVRSFALKSTEDLPAEKWLEELRFAERMLKDRAGPSLPGRELPAPAGRAPLAERVAKVKAKKGGAQ